MKKLTKFSIGLVVLGLSLALSACKHDVGTAPVINDAFFASQCDNNATFNQTKASYETKHLHPSSSSDTSELEILITDLEKDFNELQISYSSDFSSFLRRSITVNEDDDTTIWIWNYTKNIWDAFYEDQQEYLASQSSITIYLRVSDSQGNMSDVFSISGLTMD